MSCYSPCSFGNYIIHLPDSGKSQSPKFPWSFGKSAENLDHWDLLLLQLRISMGINLSQKTRFPLRLGFNRIYSFHLNYYEGHKCISVWCFRTNKINIQYVTIDCAVKAILSALYKISHNPQTILERYKVLWVQLYTWGSYSIELNNLS